MQEIDLTPGICILHFTAAKSLSNSNNNTVSLAKVQAMIHQWKRDQPRNSYPLFELLRLQTLAGGSDDKVALWTLLNMVYRVGPEQADYLSPYDMSDTTRALWYHMLAMFDAKSPKSSSTPESPDGMPAKFVPVLHLARSYSIGV